MAVVLQCLICDKEEKKKHISIVLYAQTHKHTHKHTRTHTDTHKHTNTNLQKHIPTQTHTETHTFTQTYTHKHKQTYTHTYIYKHTYTYRHEHTQTNILDFGMSGTPLPPRYFMRPIFSYSWTSKLKDITSLPKKMAANTELLPLKGHRVHFWSKISSIFQNTLIYVLFYLQAWYWCLII